MGLRPPRADDAPAVAELLGAESPEPVTAESLVHQWTSPRVDLERDARFAAGEYALVEAIDGRAFVRFAGKPSEELMEWALARARESAGRVLAGAWSGDDGVIRALESRAFRRVRQSWRMVIGLEEEPEEPRWPPGIEVRTFQEGDERAFYDVHQESFDDHWEAVRIPYAEWAHHLLEGPTFEPALWFLALDGGEPAGCAICQVHPADPELGIVIILGVRRPWRRRGLGRALLLHAFREFRARGLRRAGLGVDAENLTGAQHLYENVGMRVAHRFDIYEKTLAH